MDLQSTAERERRAKVTEAEGIKRAKELIAEGDKSSVELNALAKKNAMILEAEGMLNSAKNLEKVPKDVLEYWMQLRHIQMVGDVAQKGSHSTYFVNRDLTALPTLSAYNELVKK